MTASGVTSLISIMISSASRGPVQQFVPTRLAPASVRPDAAWAGLVPIMVRWPLAPFANAIVATTGLRETSFAAAIARVASFRSDMVSIKKKSTPACSINSAVRLNPSASCSAE